MKHLTVTAISLVFVGLAVVISCDKDDDKVNLPLVTTAAASDIQPTSAVVGGNVTDDGGADISERGVFWGTSADPQTKLPIGAGSGSFSATLDDLDADTEYFVKAFATNSEGTAFGEIVSFSTGAGLAVVQTLDVESITTISAVVGANVTEQGASAVQSAGVYWGIDPDLTLTGTLFELGNNTGEVSATLSGLDDGTTYYVMGYATNASGTAFGEVLSFETVDGVVTDVDGNEYGVITFGTQMWLDADLRVTKYQNGDEIPALYGDDWATPLNTGALQWVFQDEENSYMGAFYNWFTVADDRGVCPAGFRVPSLDDFDELYAFVEQDGHAGRVANALKSCRQVDSELGGDCDTREHPRWNAHATHHGTDDYGFGALPLGSAHFGGLTANGLIGRRAHWWTTNEDPADEQRANMAIFDAGQGMPVATFTMWKNMGYHIRCVRINE